MRVITEQIFQECSAKFKELESYQINFAFTCSQIIGFEGKNVLEVGGALPREFVFDYLNAFSWTALDAVSYSETLAIMHSEYQDVVKRVKQSVEKSLYTRTDGTFSWYKVFLMNIENLPLEHYGKYDLIYSSATFEHLNQFPGALGKMFQALKPGGILFSMFSPIWSAYNGHHLRNISDKEGKVTYNFGNSPIPPWGHLLMRPPDLYRHLTQITDAETAQKILYDVFHCPSINRLFTEDYVDFVSQTSFIVREMQATFNTTVPAQIQEQLERIYPGRKLFGNNGILMILEKPLTTD